MNCYCFNKRYIVLIKELQLVIFMLRGFENKLVLVIIYIKRYYFYLFQVRKDKPVHYVGGSFFMEGANMQTVYLIVSDGRCPWTTAIYHYHNVFKTSWPGELLIAILFFRKVVYVSIHSHHIRIHSKYSLIVLSVSEWEGSIMSSLMHVRLWHSLLNC